MQWKEGGGWKAGFDEERGVCTAETSFFGAGGSAYHIYEITKDVFDRLDPADDDASARLIHEGRHLYMDVNDKCGPPYTVVLDEDYRTLCPWAQVKQSGPVWDAELTDAAVELFASEAQNREQRRRKRERREAEGKQ